MAAKKTEDDRSLKRLGGGRWQTRDERFTIEPQSGTWVLVDAEQTDDLGLPLVRGPFRSLTEAKAAVEDAWGTAAPESPLADRVKEAGARSATTPAVVAAPIAGGAPKAGAKPAAGPSRSRPAEPEPPPEPRWIADLAPRERGRARRLIERLEEAGVRDAESVVRQDVTGGVPTVARLVLADRLAGLLPLGPGDAPAIDGVIRQVVEALGDGRDDDLGVRWRLVDDVDRPIGLTARDFKAAIDRRVDAARKERKR